MTQLPQNGIHLTRRNMALSKTKTIICVNQEVTFQNTYIVIDKIEGDKNEMQIHVKMLVEKDGPVIKKTRHSFTINHDLPLYTQAYNYLKSTPEFCDSQDC